MPTAADRLESLRWISVAVAPWSFLASLALLVCIFRLKNHQRNTVFHRLMIGVATHDCLSSLGFSFGPIPIPRSLQVPYAFGTQGTCSMQAVLITAVSTAHIYETALSIYFLLIIRFNWTEDRIAKIVEPWMHVIALSWGYGSIVALLTTDVFNPAPSLNFCWFGFTPPFCKYIPGVECTRGQTYERLYLQLYIFPTLSVFGLLVLTLALVIFTIRSQLRKNIRYVFRGHYSTSRGGWRGPISRPALQVDTSSSQRASHRGSSMDVVESNEVAIKPSPSQDCMQLAISSATPHENANDESQCCAANAHDTKPPPSKQSSPTMNKVVDREASSRSLWGSQRSERSSRDRLLHQAVTQCLSYGFLYLFCVVWTITAAMLDLRDRDDEFLTRFYWVRNCMKCFFDIFCDFVMSNCSLRLCLLSQNITAYCNVLDSLSITRTV
jgi:hypothetical protein